MLKTTCVAIYLQKKTQERISKSRAAEVAQTQVEKAWAVSRRRAFMKQKQSAEAWSPSVGWIAEAEGEGRGWSGEPWAQARPSNHLDSSFRAKTALKRRKNKFENSKWNLPFGLAADAANRKMHISANKQQNYHLI